MKRTIAVPKLEEQESIAEKLFFAESMGTQRRLTLKLMDEYVRSIFVEIFGDAATNPKGWPIRRLDEVSSIGSGVTKGKRYLNQLVTPVPYLRVANVQAGYLDLGEVKTIDVPPLEVERYRLEKGDVLMTEGGDWDKLGRGAVWDGSIAPCIHQNHIFRARCDRTLILAEYLDSLLQTEYAKAYFQKAAKQTTNLATINKTQLSAFPIPIPPISLQLEYAMRRTSRDRLRERMDRSLLEMHSLFQSVLNEVFLAPTESPAQSQLTSAPSLE